MEDLNWERKIKSTPWYLLIHCRLWMQCILVAKHYILRDGVLCYLVHICKKLKSRLLNANQGHLRRVSTPVNSWKNIKNNRSQVKIKTDSATAWLISCLKCLSKHNIIIKKVSKPFWSSLKSQSRRTTTVSEIIAPYSLLKDFSVVSSSVKWENTVGHCSGHFFVPDDGIVYAMLG